MIGDNEFSAAFSSAFDAFTITTPGDVSVWLGGRVDPVLLDDAWRAAEAYVQERTMNPDESGLPDENRVMAVNLLTARYLQRRNSPDGIVGMGDLGPARVPFSDIDVERLLNPSRFFPVA